MTAPRRKLADLPPLEQRLAAVVVQHWIDASIRRGKSADADLNFAILSALDHLGIACPHEPKRASKYYRDPRCVLECAICGTVEFLDFAPAPREVTVHRCAVLPGGAVDAFGLPCPTPTCRFYRGPWARPPIFERKRVDWSTIHVLDPIAAEVRFETFKTQSFAWLGRKRRVLRRWCEWERLGA